MKFEKRNCIFPSQKYNDHYVDDMIAAIKAKEPYSWIRFGDGEIVFLEQEYVRPVNQIRKSVGWSASTNYCGASIPNIDLRDRMVEALGKSTLVGMFQGDPPMMKCLEKINVYPENICYAFDNVFLPMNAYFVNNILLKNKLLFVGRESNFYKKKFKEVLGVDAVGTVQINSYADIDKCMDEMCKYEYDVALVSAGVNANVICYEMTKKLNRVFLDMGHAWDNAFHQPPNYKEYWLIPAWQEGKAYLANEKVIYNDDLYFNNSGTSITTNPSEDLERWTKEQNLLPVQL